MKNLSKTELIVIIVFVLIVLAVIAAIVFSNKTKVYQPTTVTEERNVYSMVGDIANALGGVAGSAMLAYGGKK